MNHAVTAAGPCGRVLTALLALLILAGTSRADAQSIVIDHAGGAVLHQDRADVPWRPASLTKLMTLHLIFDALRDRRITLATRWTVSRRAAGQPATRLGLDAGDTITVENAILALIVRSANDVATVAAEALGGTEMNFARLMTARARALGMQHTVFRNASGLPARGQISTARDLAILARSLIDHHRAYYHYFNTQEFTSGVRTVSTHNRLLNWYDGADGLKTGYIRASGFNLATSAVRNGRRLVGVVLGGPTARARDEEMARLLDAAFARAPALPRQQIAQLIEANTPPAGEGDTDAEPVRPAPPRPAATPVLPVRPVAAAPPPAATRAALWGVQVGDYSDEAGGRAAASRAATVARRVGRFATDIETRRGSRTVYRARLLRMTEAQAAAVCRTLRARRIACTPLQPDEL